MRAVRRLSPAAGATAAVILALVMLSITEAYSDGPYGAFQGMKAFDFERGVGHGALNDFVYDYYSRMGQKGVAVSSGGNK